MEGEAAYLPLLEYLMREEKKGFSFSVKMEEKIQRIRLGGIARNGIFLREYREIMKNLEKTGVKAILLKGLSMENLYPDGIRTFCDIDLLVKKEDMGKTGRVLNRLGYAGNVEPRPGAIDIRKTAGYMKKGRIPLMVECHYRLGPCPYMDRITTSSLLRDAREVEIGNRKTLVLSCEDLLIHLALHIFSHIPDPCVISACDIRQLVKYRGVMIDWEVFLSKVERHGLSMPVRYAFQQAEKFFDIPFPGYVGERLASLKKGRKERLIFSLLCSGKSMAVNLGKFSFGLRTVKKIQLIFYMLFPSRRYLLHKYPEASRHIFFSLYLKHVKENALFAFSWIFSHL